MGSARGRELFTDEVADDRDGHPLFSQPMSLDLGPDHADYERGQSAFSRSPAVVRRDQRRDRPILLPPSMPIAQSRSRGCTKGNIAPRLRGLEFPCHDRSNGLIAGLGTPRIGRIAPFFRKNTVATLNIEHPEPCDRLKVVGKTFEGGQFAGGISVYRATEKRDLSSVVSLKQVLMAHDTSLS